MRADLAHAVHQGDPAIIFAAAFLVIVNLGGAAAYLLGWFA